MKKIMIIDSDPAFTKELSKFFYGNTSYQIVGSASDGDSALKLIPSLNPDVIILDVILPKTDGFSILKHYGQDEKIKIIAVSSLNNGNFVSKILDFGVNCFMLKPISPLNLKEHLDEMFAISTSNTTYNSHSSHSKNLLNEKITNIFIQIGIPANIKGYLFLKEAVKLTMENAEIINSITKKLYPKIADCFNTSPCGVERCIRNAIEIAWNRGRLANINTVFGMPVYGINYKPSNGELIALLADKLLSESACGY